MSQVFLTGGAGFIGSRMVPRLLDRGDKVVVFDNLLLGRREFLQPYLSNPNFRFVQADLTDLLAVKREMKGCDLVIHLAANSDISQGPAKNDLDFRNGTLATYNVLEAMRELSVKKIVFASTSAVYGEARVKPTPESYGPLFPISFYGASKLACEALISAFAHNCGMRGWIFRFANIVGPNSTHGAIFDFVGRLLGHPSELKILGDGTQRKSYLHVDDCINGILFGINKAQGYPDRREIDCLNLASHGVTTVREIAEDVILEMQRVSGIRAQLILGEGDRGWKGDVPYTHLDGSAMNQLGWKPELDSRAAVRKAVSEVVQQLAGIRSSSPRPSAPIEK